MSIAVVPQARQSEQDYLRRRASGRNLPMAKHPHATDSTGAVPVVSQPIPDPSSKRRFWVEWPESQELFHLLRSLFAPMPVSRVLHKHKHQFLAIGRQAYVWPVISGWAIPYRTSPDGRSKCTQFVGPRDIVGISGYGGNTRELGVYPLTEVTVVGIPSPHFYSVLRQNADLASLMFTYASNCYARTLDEIEEVSLYPLEDRLKSMEARLADVPVKHLSDTEAGWIVGAHAGSVSRALLRSREQG